MEISSLFRWLRDALLGLAAILGILLALVVPSFLVLAISSGYPDWAPPVLLLFTAGALAGLWQAWAAMRRGEWRRAAAWSTPFVVALAAAIPLDRALTRANALQWRERLAEEVLATTDLEGPISYDSAQCTAIYWCSFATFALPASLEHRFRGSGARDPDHGPRVPAYLGSRWNAGAWVATPIPDAYKKHLDFVLAQDHRFEDAPVLPYAEQIRSVASRPGSYLGVIQRNDGSEFMDVDLFVIDLETRRIFLASRDWQR